MSIDQQSRALQGDYDVDCSEAGPGYEKMTPGLIKRLGIPPGCGLVFGKDAYSYVYLLASFVVYLAMALVLSEQ